MPKRIIAFVASLAVLIGLMNCGTSYAWFSTSISKSQSIVVSVVSSVHSAYLTDLTSSGKTIIMQGDNLVSLDGRGASLQIQNKSNTDSQLRISIEYTSCKTGAPKQVNYSASSDDDIVVKFPERTWSKHVNSGDVSYFYYMGDKFVSDEINSLDGVPSINPKISTIEAIKSIAYKDDVSMAYSGQDINVKVIFEYKQADNVTWQAVDTYEVDGVVNG